jgi:hypothetical protein
LSALEAFLGDAAQGGNEPILHDAAQRSNGRNVRDSVEKLRMVLIRIPNIVFRAPSFQHLVAKITEICCLQSFSTESTTTRTFGERALCVFLTQLGHLLDRSNRYLSKNPR